MDIETINTYAAKHTIFGWFLGLAYYGWFSATAPHVPLWGYLVLIFVGMFAVSLIIGAGVALIMAGVTRIATGNAEGSPHGFAWGAYISPILAFLAAKYALAFMAWGN